MNNLKNIFTMTMVFITTLVLFVLADSVLALVITLVASSINNSWQGDVFKVVFLLTFIPELIATLVAVVKVVREGDKTNGS